MGTIKPIRSLVQRTNKTKETKMETKMRNVQKTYNVDGIEVKAQVFIDNFDPVICSEGDYTRAIVYLSIIYDRTIEQLKELADSGYMRWHFIPEAKDWEDGHAKMIKLAQAMLLDLYNNAGPAVSREVSEYTATIAVAYGGTMGAYYTANYNVNTKEVDVYAGSSSNIADTVPYEGIENHLYLTHESFN